MAEPAPQSETARVIAVRDEAATQAFRPDPNVVRRMVVRGVQAWTGKTNEAAAWQALVSKDDVVGIKVHSSPGPNSGTRVAVAAAVVQGLIGAGLPPTNIIVWDKQIVDLRLSGFYELAETYGVRVEGSLQAGYDPEVFYENAMMGSLVWGDLEFGTKNDTIGRKSHVTTLLTKRITKVISIPPLLNHNLAGVCGNLYSVALGAVDNAARFESSSDRLIVPLPEIYNMTAIADKVALCIVDALICQYEGGERALLHYSTALNELRFGADPVALDVLSLQDVSRFRQQNNAPRLRQPLDIYSNAALLELGIADARQIRVETIH